MITILIFIYTLAVNHSSFTKHSTEQVFINEGFQINCSCKLQSNQLFIQSYKRSGGNNLIAAYYCAENENNTENGVIYNINIYDESALYVNLPIKTFPIVNEKYLASYEKGLKSSKIPYQYISYFGAPALEYEYLNAGLQYKSIVFIKDKKSYLIQVGTRMDLNQKFTSIINSFKFL